MKLEGHTVVITGGGTGIGAGLAGAFRRAGSKVIICGRRADRLAQVAAANPGMETMTLDVRDSASVKRASEALALKHPGIDVVINNAGLQKNLDFDAGTVSPADIDDEVATNLKGPAYVCAAFIPLLKRQPAAWLINVSSGLMYVPLAFMPMYCATKAAVHSFTLSLRYQLRKTPVKVIEIVPPAVKTDLDQEPSSDGGHEEMPVAEFVSRAVKELRSGKNEVVIGQSKRLRLGSRLAPGLFFGFLNP